MTKTLTYDQLQSGKRYLATVEVRTRSTVNDPNAAYIYGVDWSTDATYEEIPEPPKPLAVGDRVKLRKGVGVIKAIDAGDAWVSHGNGIRFTYALSDLTRIEGEG